MIADACRVALCHIEIRGNGTNIPAKGNGVSTPAAWLVTTVATATCADLLIEPTFPVYGHYRR